MPTARVAPPGHRSPATSPFFVGGLEGGKPVDRDERREFVKQNCVCVYESARTPGERGRRLDR
jgi:hypothetical protein